MENETKNTSNKPAFYAYTVHDRIGKDAVWTRIGAAFANKDGEGYNILLEAYPTNAKLTLRIPKEDSAEQQSSQLGAARKGGPSFSGCPGTLGFASTTSRYRFSGEDFGTWPISANLLKRCPASGISAAPPDVSGRELKGTSSPNKLNAPSFGLFMNEGDIQREVSQQNNAMKNQLRLHRIDALGDAHRSTDVSGRFCLQSTDVSGRFCLQSTDVSGRIYRCFGEGFFRLTDVSGRVYRCFGEGLSLQTLMSIDLP
jgi:hypothetical protein